MTEVSPAACGRCLAVDADIAEVRAARTDDAGPMRSGPGVGRVVHRV